jgi:hypothetical protein
MISYKHLGRVRSGNTFGFAKSRSLLTNGRQSGDSRLTEISANRKRDGQTGFDEMR